VRLPNSILYLAVDSFLPLHGKPAPTFANFLAQLESAGTPVVWVSSRNRFQLETPRRILAHNHPFIAEGGCGVYIPEGYFNVRADKALRLGRFMCIPVAQQQPAAADALEQLCAETAVAAVPLKDLSPRELGQNTGLPAREATPMTHRDFDELFFLAGASDEESLRFRNAAREQRISLRKADGFWSIALGANVVKCVRELDRLYARALRTRVGSAAVAMAGDQLLSACDRHFALTDSRDAEEAASLEGIRTKPQSRGYLHDRELWDHVWAWAARSGR
jgi:predicted mannosyl-3-phosphoglycerate phosphatase (HAD superfamily)